MFKNKICYSLLALGMHLPHFTFIPMVKLVSNYASFELCEVFRK
jgi:hypothetical protein